MPGAKTYSALAERLKALRCAEWTDAEGWNNRYSGQAGSIAGRRAEGALLARVLGISESADARGAWAPAPEVMVIPLGETAGAQISNKMRRIYEAFCKTIEPADGRAEAEESIRCFLTARNRAFRVDDFADARSFAYILFRRRFEVTDRLNGQHLATRFLSDSMKGLLSTFSSDLEAWSRFLDLCYRAELRYCQHLRNLTDGLVPGEPSWKEIISMHSAALSPLMLPLPYGVGILKVTRAEHYFAAIALADSP